MVSEFFAYVANLIIAALFHGGSISVPTSMKIAIYEVMPDRAVAGGTETNYAGYARQTVACGASSKWDAPSTSSGRRVTKNTDLISFPTSTEPTDTHHAAGYVVYDNTGTNPIFKDTHAFDITPGFTPTLAPGALILGFTAATPMSYDFQDAILNVFFRNTAFAALTSIVVAQKTTMPSKVDGSGGVSANYTGYAAQTLLSGAVTSDWDAAESDVNGYRKCKNTALIVFGAENSGAPQTLAGETLTSNGGLLLTLAAYSPTLPIALGTTFKHKAGELSIGF